MIWIPAHLPLSVPGLLHAYGAPLLALGVALVGTLACRGKRAQAFGPAVGAAALLAGWAALLPPLAALHAVLRPRAMPDFLLLPALAALVAALLAAWVRTRWLAVALAMGTGWWLAGSPAGRPEFWRVGFVVTCLAALLFRAVAGRAERSLAGGLALWGGLVLAGAPPVWIAASLATAAAAAGLMAARPGGALPAAATAAMIGAADLAAGRLVRGALNGADLACLAACGAPFLVPVLQARLGKRLGAAGPVLAAAAAAVIAVLCAWAVTRLMRR